MQRRSSGSSGDDVDTPDEQRSAKVVDQSLSTRRSQDSRQPEENQHKAQQTRPSSARSRHHSGAASWKNNHNRNGAAEKATPTKATSHSFLVNRPEPSGGLGDKMAETKLPGRRARSLNPWALSPLTFLTAILGIGFLVAILHSSSTRQLDRKGCRMSYMRPSYTRMEEFDTEHTRFASKYSLYLYREEGIDDPSKVKGIPVLFIPGNAGSYKQVRPIAAEAANYFHDVLEHNSAALDSGVRSLDFFTVDFNEDFTAFHGQTMLDQAEYLNEAIRYILSLYMDPRMSQRDPSLPDPTSVIILGHSMGGVVARTMLTMPNYQSNSINTIVTMSAPHSRPPVTFDPQIVELYKEINEYWRHAYSQKWANNNPLWHVTLVSIAGGGLDTVVPSDYASVEPIVPETHGFTVFTSSIPTVWTSADHQAILWCDQFRKVIAQTLFDIVDSSRASQTRPRAERMRVFRRRLLTGLENVNEKSLAHKEPDTLLTLEDNSNAIMPQGERLVLRQLGLAGKLQAHLLPVPQHNPAERMRFTLLTDTQLDGPGEMGNLEVLFCSVYPLQPGQANALFSMNMDLSGDTTGSTRLACKNTATDTIRLPPSTRDTRYPFFLDGEQPTTPFSYLQYDLKDLSDYQFVAVVDKAGSITDNWAVAEFSDRAHSQLSRQISLRKLLAYGAQFTLPANRPTVTELRLPVIEGSLLAYHLEISEQTCNNANALFTPLVRQHLSEPYESKFFVNVHNAQISLHGVAPYVPPPMNPKKSESGLGFQLWTDPTCGSSISVKLTVDPLGSLGKLYMRYRTVFAAFPLLVVALVLRKQFRVYDSTGVFIPFTESLDICLRQSLPLLLLSLTLLSLSVGQPTAPGSHSLWSWRNNTMGLDFTQNDLLTGTPDPFFWFLVPLIGIVCIGVCIVLHYIAMVLISILSIVYGWIHRPSWTRHDDKKRVSPVFAPSSPRRRLITTAILLVLVSTAIPYQFAYVVACLVQLGTCAKAARLARDIRSPASINFFNYTHSIFILMLWVLPINLPTLVVWVRNLTVHWFTPFSSHHNVLSILPFILLVETLTGGKMVPRVTGQLRHLTSLFLFGIAIYAAIYGVSYAYMLHYLVNLVAAWLVAVHLSSGSWTISGLSTMFDSETADYQKQEKTP